MKRLLIITALLALLLPVQAVGADAKKTVLLAAPVSGRNRMCHKPRHSESRLISKSGKTGRSAHILQKEPQKQRLAIQSYYHLADGRDTLSLQYGQAHAAKRAKAQYVPPNLLIHIRYHHFCIVAFQHPHIPEPETPTKR